MVRTPFLRTLRYALAALLFAGFSSGCITDNKVRLVSSSTGNADIPTLTTAAYVDEGSGGASIYLTDLGHDALDNGRDIKLLSGRIVEIRMFLTPSAGDTPIGRSACTATIRHIILANGSIGIYSGGGFLWPSGSLGEPHFGGTLENAAMRLTGSTENFSDRLGAATLNARFTARRDAPLAKRIASRVDDVLLLTGQPKAASAR